MRQFIGFFICLLLSSPVLAQSGPWASSSAKLKGDALIRDSAGGYLQEVKSIVQGGGDVNWTLSGGLTPLLSAASGGHLEIVRFLLEQGADIDHRDSWGHSALDKARATGAYDVVKFLEARTAQAEQPLVGATPAQSPVSPALPTPSSTADSWPAFGSFKVGDRVRFLLSNGWRVGTVREVGEMGGSESWKEKKYYIASDLFPNSPEWIEWGRVAGEQPAPYWSSFFVGSWNLGEGMAINSSVAGNTETTEFAYRSATESLNLNGDGGFRWVTVDGQTRTGRWTPATDGPGVVLANGADGATWILRNETNAIEENIRGIQSARLTTEGKMSIVATRPVR